MSYDLRPPSPPRAPSRAIAVTSYCWCGHQAEVHEGDGCRACASPSSSTCSGFVAANRHARRRLRVQARADARRVRA